MTGSAYVPEHANEETLRERIEPRGYEVVVGGAGIRGRR